jgi:uncharacterized RDD family membrane protein YckC
MAYGSAVDPRLADGTLGKRFLAYLIDIVVLFIIGAVLWVLIGIFGIVTLSLGWALYALLPIVPIVYNAVTVGGPAQGTIGMRIAGVRAIDAQTGGRVSWIMAAAHALLFYVAVVSYGTLWVIDIAIGLFRADRRLGHDLLTSIAFVRTA